jgi:hypothetical protein
MHLKISSKYDDLKNQKAREATFTFAPASPPAPAEYVLQNKLFFII